MWPGVGVAERQRDGPTEQFEQSSQTSRFKEGWMMMCGLQKDLGRGGVLAGLRSSFWMADLIRLDRQGEKQILAEQKARMVAGKRRWISVGEDGF